MYFRVFVNCNSSMTPGSQLYGSVVESAEQGFAASDSRLYRAQYRGRRGQNCIWDYTTTFAIIWIKAVCLHGDSYRFDETNRPRSRILSTCIDFHHGVDV